MRSQLTCGSKVIHQYQMALDVAGALRKAGFAAKATDLGQDDSKKVVSEFEQCAFQIVRTKY